MRILNESAKAVLCWLGYKNRTGLATATRRGVKAAYRSPAVHWLGTEAKVRWQKSEKSLRRAKWALFVAVIGALAIGAVGQMQVDPHRAMVVQYAAGLMLVAPAVFAFFTALWQLGKFEVLEELIIFALLSARRGYEEAIRLLPEFVGRGLSGITDPIIMPLVIEAKRLTKLLWSIFLGAVTLAQFQYRFKIFTNPSEFSLVILGTFGFIAWAVTSDREVKFLRPAALAMSIFTFVSAAFICVTPSFAAKGGRDFCMKEYYVHGTPSDQTLVSQCKADVGPETMQHLMRFNVLKAKRSNAQERLEFDALDTVIRGEMDGKPKPLVYGEPQPPPPPAPPPTPGNGVKPKPAKIPSTTAAIPKQPSDPIYARMQERHKKLIKDLGGDQ